MDEELWEKLDALKFQPMICGIRWIRLLFIREFPVDQLVSLWDYFFVRFRVDEDFLCIEELALAMMLHLKPTLMKCKSPIEVIQKVQRFPKIKCSLPLVANAHKIKSRRKTRLKISENPPELVRLDQDSRRKRGNQPEPGQY